MNEANKVKELEKDLARIPRPVNDGISVVDIANKSKGKFVEVYIGMRHYQGRIISVDDYFNLCLDDGNKLHFLKATKITEIILLKDGL